MMVIEDILEDYPWGIIHGRVDYPWNWAYGGDRGLRIYGPNVDDVPLKSSNINFVFLFAFFFFVFLSQAPYS